MIHRSRRASPTLPARRGMRAAWFRGRATETGGRPTEPASQAPEQPPATEPVEPAAPAPVRPAMGHPTF